MTPSTTSRRDFLRTLGLATVCMCSGMAGLNGCSMIKGVSSTPGIPEEAYLLQNNSLTIDLKLCPTLAEEGGAGKLSIEQDGLKPLKIIVLNKGNNQYTAYSDCCTHGGKELNYLHQESKLQCSSFGHSEFNLKGQVLKGPAEGPLAVYPVERQDTRLVITIT